METLDEETVRGYFNQYTEPDLTAIKSQAQLNVQELFEVFADHLDATEIKPVKPS
jgi:hypothetical protein